MNQYNQIRKTRNAREEVNYEIFFDNPELDFVMATDDDSKYIVGVMDNGDGYIYKPYAYRPIEAYNCIHFRSKARRELYDECIECYVLSCLCGDYELAYMDIHFHVLLWEFIDSYIHEIDYMLKDGVKKYLKFCKETGITQKVLETYGETLLPDLYDIFLEDDIPLFDGLAINLLNGEEING